MKNTYIYIYQKILKKYTNVSTKICFSWAANQHIRMISVGSCDTEVTAGVKLSFPITGINYI